MLVLDLKFSCVQTYYPPRVAWPGEGMAVFAVLCVLSATGLVLQVTPDCNDCFSMEKSISEEKLRGMMESDQRDMIETLKGEIADQKVKNEHQNTTLSANLKKLEDRLERDSGFLAEMKTKAKANKDQRKDDFDGVKQSVSAKQGELDEAKKAYDDLRYEWSKVNKEVMAKTLKLQSCECKGALLQGSAPNFDLMKEIRKLEDERNKLMKTYSSTQVSYNAKSEALMRQIDGIATKKDKHLRQSDEARDQMAKLYKAVKQQERVLSSAGPKGAATQTKMEGDLADAQAQLKELEAHIKECRC
mmetsp:Transcript_30532/g.64763  ORF Transcript_30532/g.64763 Transcript_30532/m.64763 type:complete len:302 (-) Transcript_30532:67-972(-)